MVTETVTKRWRVEHCNECGVVQNTIEAASRATLGKLLAAEIKDWLLGDGDSIHIIRQTED